MAGKSTSRVRIRSALIGDTVDIASILREAFIEFESLYTPPAFVATSPTPDQILARWNAGPVWVAVQSEMLVGTVAAIPKSVGIYVRSMAVLPAARGQGIAER